MKVSAKHRFGLALFLALAILAVPSQPAFALIVGGEGNKPLDDPGWPQGAAIIFNNEGRVAWWEGPPFGGGQWHAECRGNAKTLTNVLAQFAHLDVKSKRVFLHDGVGRSFWLNLNNDPAKREAAKIDWSFVVWQPGNWDRLRKLPADFNPTDPGDADSGPPARLDIHTGGNIKWADVIVPKGLTIVDNRLEAHGFKLTDGIVLEGRVIDLATKKPIAAKVRVETTDLQDGKHRQEAEVTASAEGRWVIKKAPAGSYRVVVEADGYVPRIASYLHFDDQPRWQSYETGLARPASVTGRVLDAAGKALADVEVRFGDVSASAGRYDALTADRVKTDKEGRFRAELPAGTATIWLHKPGYVRPGLGLAIATPKKDVELTMVQSARIEVTVDFTGKQRPEGYIVRLQPEGGDKIGTYGGSGSIDMKDRMNFEQVPPGRYILTGRPNPGADNQETDPVTIDLKGGQSAKVTLNAK